MSVSLHQGQARATFGDISLMQALRCSTDVMHHDCSDPCLQNSRRPRTAECAGQRQQCCQHILLHETDGQQPGPWVCILLVGQSSATQCTGRSTFTGSSPLCILAQHCSNHTKNLLAATTGICGRWWLSAKATAKSSWYCPGVLTACCDYCRFPFVFVYIATAWICWLLTRYYKVSYWERCMV